MCSYIVLRDCYNSDLTFLYLDRFCYGIAQPIWMLACIVGQHLWSWQLVWPSRAWWKTWSTLRQTLRPLITTVSVDSYRHICLKGLNDAMLLVCPKTHCIKWHSVICHWTQSTKWCNISVTGHSALNDTMLSVTWHKSSNDALLSVTGHRALNDVMLSDRTRSTKWCNVICHRTKEH